MSGAVHTLPAGAPVRASLARNVTAMYALQIANSLIPLATLPYLVRVLGAAHYGQMAMAYAVVFFMVLFVDAGFNTLALRRLARPGIAIARIARIYAATQWIKLAQSLAMFALLLALIAGVPDMRAAAPVYLATFPIVLGSLLFPTWLFQGLEVMHYTTLCSVGGRVLATLGIFAFVNGPGDLVLAAALQASATALSGLLSLPVVFGRLGIRPPLPGRRLRPELRRIMAEARSLAPAEYATNAIGTSGVFVLGLFASDAAVGIYAALEKVARAAASLFEPLTKALFPRIAGLWMSADAAAPAACRAWTQRLGVLAVTAATVMTALAAPGLELLFGSGWSAQAPLLRVFALWLALAVAAGVVGQFWLLARGRRTAYAHCLLAGAAVQFPLALLAAMHYGATGLAAAFAAAELVRLTLCLRASRPTAEGIPPCAS